MSKKKKIEISFDEGSNNIAPISDPIWENDFDQDEEEELLESVSTVADRTRGLETRYDMITIEHVLRT